MHRGHRHAGRRAGDGRAFYAAANHVAAPDDFVLVDDDEMMRAVRIYLEQAKTLAELAGAAPLAAAIKCASGFAGKRAALILSGGNTSAKNWRCLEAS